MYKISNYRKMLFYIPFKFFNYFGIFIIVYVYIVLLPYRVMHFILDMIVVYFYNYKYFYFFFKTPSVKRQTFLATSLYIR